MCVAWRKRRVWLGCRMSVDGCVGALVWRRDRLDLHRLRQLFTVHYQVSQRSGTRWVHARYHLPIVIHLVDCATIVAVRAEGRALDRGRAGCLPAGSERDAGRWEESIDGDFLCCCRMLCRLLNVAGLKGRFPPGSRRANKSPRLTPPARRLPGG